MDFTDRAIVSKRLVDAAFDLAQIGIAERNQNAQEIIKHSRDAGEAISQAFEFALRFHLNSKMKSVEKRYFNIRRSNLWELLSKYLNEDGSEGDYYFDTVSEDINPSVNFKYLKDNKFLVTNQSKHEGAHPDISVQRTYYLEVLRFYREYIDATSELKSVEDFEGVNFGNWDLFYTSCDRFSPEERNYILIIGPNNGVDKEYIKSLSICKWDLIIDFDYFSKRDGLFKSGYEHDEITSHQIKAGDIVGLNTFTPYSKSHYHYFANNFENSGLPAPKDYNDWSMKYGRKVNQMISSYASVCQSQKTIVVILYPEFRYVNFLCDAFKQSFGESILFVTANDKEEKLSLLREYFDALNVNISLPEISQGINAFSSNFGKSDHKIDHFELPFLSTSETKDVTGIFTNDEFARLEEDFEVFHLGLPIRAQEEDRRIFLTGEKKISPYGLKARFDVERQNFNKKYTKPIEKLIEKGRGKVFLQHEAGFGGTSVARRIAWDIHTDYPTLILKKFRDNKVKEQIVLLHQKTRKTIFIVMEVPQTITLDEVETLYRSIPPARPVVFLIVKRGKPGSNDLSVTDWGNDVWDLIKTFTPFFDEYSNPQVKERKLKELQLAASSNEPYKKTPFYIGLLAFDDKFFALKEYIGNFAVEVSNNASQRKVLVFLAIAYDYLGQSLPASFFRNIFNFSRNQMDLFALEKCFNKNSSIVESLLAVRYIGKQKFWSIRHAFFAKELKVQILSGQSENPETWKHELSKNCIDLIEESVAEGVNSDYIEDFLKNLFIGNRKDRAGEDFTPIIKDIPTIEEKEAVFTSLIDSYPNNPHYYSHLARFYAYNYKNPEKALYYANRAIELSELLEIDDPLLHHIKGMCLRTIAYDLMEDQVRLKKAGKLTDPQLYDQIIYELVPDAEAEFTKSREIIQKDNRIDGHGYVAHIQLLIRVIDFGIIISGQSKKDFLSSNKEPFSHWLDLAESLLEDVKGLNHNGDESGKIEECENDIQDIYENYEIILQNLRNQLAKSSNPSRTRRHIVRTYMRRSNEYYKDTSVVESILELLQDNIENEPDNEKNFFLWFKVARFSKVSLEQALSKLSKWNAQSTTIDTVYYLYILKVIRALEGYSDAAPEADRLIKECHFKGRSNISIYEWYGKGNDLKRIVNRNEVSEANKAEKLEYVKGVFSKYNHDGSGEIIIMDKLRVYFSPTQAKLSSTDQNKDVIFYLGFSYDGLRADSASVKLASK